MAALLLLGDSITEAFPAEELLGEHTVTNAGVYGDNTRLLLQRLDRDVRPHAADILLLLIGTNDMACGYSSGETIRSIGECVRRIRTYGGIRSVVVQSILPTRGVENRPNLRIQYLNAHLRRLAAAEGCGYWDIHSLFVNSHGEMAEEFSDDGLHLTRRGYAVWAAQINAFLRTERTPTNRP